MTNTNPKTGIRYGVIALNNLDPDVAHDLWTRGTDLSYEEALDELTGEVTKEADEIEESAEIKAREIGGFTDREYEDFVEREIEQMYHARGYDDRDEFINEEVVSRAEDIHIEEPTIEGECEGVKYHITHLGGAPLLWVFEGPIGRCRALCSPCVPNAGDLDSGFTTDEVNEGYECYVVPQDWMSEERVMSNVVKLRFHPQAWVNDYAMEVDPEGETDWEIDIREVCWPIPEDDSYESDELRLADAAPEWVRDWSGPFWVEILNRDELGACNDAD